MVCPSLATTTSAAATAVAFSPWAVRSAFVAGKFSPPIVVFSKVYQTLSLSFDESAAVTAEYSETVKTVDGASYFLAQLRRH